MLKIHDPINDSWNRAIRSWLPPYLRSVSRQPPVFSYYWTRWQGRPQYLLNFISEVSDLNNGDDMAARVFVSPVLGERPVAELDNLDSAQIYEDAQRVIVLVGRRNAVRATEPRAGDPGPLARLDLRTDDEPGARLVVYGTEQDAKHCARWANPQPPRFSARSLSRWAGVLLFALGGALLSGAKVLGIRLNVPQNSEFRAIAGAELLLVAVVFTALAGSVLRRYLVPASFDRSRRRKAREDLVALATILSVMPTAAFGHVLANWAKDLSGPYSHSTSLPSNVGEAPSISGTPKQGQTQSESHGSWSSGPIVGYSYQWDDCDSAGNTCSAISGATGPIYTLTSSDVGHTIRVQEGARNADGTSLPTSSAATAVVVPLPPSNAALPSISGIARQGHTLSEAHGLWSNSSTGYSYQWQKCDSAGNGCSAIAGATDQISTLSAADVGHSLRVLEIASNVGGASTAAASRATGVVHPASTGGSGGGAGIGDGETATLTVSHITTIGTVASVEVGCSGAARSDCTVTLALTAVETIKGGKVSAVTASKKKAEKKVVELGSATVTIAAGHGKTVTISLNVTGKRLLARHHRLKTKLTVAQSTAGKTNTISSKRITFKGSQLAMVTRQVLPVAFQ